MSKIIRFLKDPWKLFTTFTLIFLALLIFSSQIWIFKSSLQQDGGDLTITTDKHSNELAIEAAAVKNFVVEDQSKNDFLLYQRGKKSYHIISHRPGEIIFSMISPNDSISAELIGTEIRLTTENETLSITQKVFGSLFGDQQITPFRVKQIEPSKVKISFSPGAYLHIMDKSKHYTLANYVTFLTNSKYLTAIKNSLIVTLISTLMAAVFGVSLAYLYSRFKIPGTSFVITLITMASIAPPFLGAYAWRMLLGSFGIVTRFFGLDWTIVGMHGVIWVISWLIFPIIFLMTYDTFTSIDHSLRECSMSLGGDRRNTFWKIELPLVMPGIINGMYLAMMTAFTDFGTPYVISLDLNVLPVLIYKEYINEIGGNFSIASTGSMIMIFLSFLLLTGQRIYLARRSYASVKTHQPSARMATPKIKIATYCLTTVVLLMAFIPHITVLITSFFEWRVGIITRIPTFANYGRLFTNNLNSIWVTLFTGGIATAFNVAFGIGIAYVIVKRKHWKVSNVLNQLVMAPYLIPGTVLGIGFIMIFNQKPLMITGTWIILVLAYFVRKLPYSVKSAESALYQVHNALGEAAESLGANSIQSFWQIVFPLMIGGVISGATLSFLQIMTEISATIILYRPPWKPMTAVVFENTIDAGADFGLASAMTVLLMLMLYIPLYIVTIKTRKPKEVHLETI